MEDYVPPPAIVFPKSMTSEAREENRACEAAIEGFANYLVQMKMPDPTVALCRELASRIALRRLALGPDGKGL